MVRKRSPTNGDAEPPRIDNLRLINGIGPAVEKRLNGVGVFTFAQLAALPPADIAAALADLTGLSSERIIKQDWIGQACKLAAQSTSSEPDWIGQARKLAAESGASQAQRDAGAAVEPPASIEHDHTATLSVESEKDAVLSMERYHAATFTLELLLDEDNNIYSTHVLHVQSKREHSWTGWQKTQLVDFLNESAGLNIPSDEPALLKAEEPDHAPVVVEEPVITEEPDNAPAVVTESEPLTPLAAKPGLAGTLHLREMEMIGVESSGPRRTLSHDEPFNVRLTLDLTELQVPGNIPLNYKASIYGKNRGSGSGLVVGEAQGTIIPADTVTIKVEGSTLPEGIYHLAGTVILGLPSMKLTVKPGTTAVIDGGQVQVF